MEGKRPRRPKSLRAMKEAAETYLQDCDKAQRFPTVTGLALALGFSGREEMDRFARQEGGQTAALLERACSQVEEETLQAVYRRDTSSGARFILQSSFGYGEKAPHEPGPITVRVEGEEG